mgnify:FL=1
MIKTSEGHDMEANTSTEPDNNPLHEAVQFYWGERCAEHEEGCPTCVAWKFYDKVIAQNDSNGRP